MANDERRKAFLNAASGGNLTLLKSQGLGKKLKKLAEVKDEECRTALHLAAAAGHTDICDHLINKFKLDVNVRDEKGDTPLILAMLDHRSSTAEYLIENGAGIMMFNDRAFTLLHYAAEKGNKEIVQLLISGGATVDINSGTPLQCAALSGKQETLKILLDNRANPNSVTLLYFTPLMLSIVANSFECLQLLLKVGANPNLGSCGKTPLIVAASQGQTEIIKYLLKLEANPVVTDAITAQLLHVGVTALEHTAMRGQVEAVMILFLVTSRISYLPDWSSAGIMKHIFSEKSRKQREHRRREFFQIAKSKGLDAFKRKDYMDAIFWYTEANLADPADASALSNWSLCWACLNQGSRALSDAQMCVKLRPGWAKAHYREGAAWMLLENCCLATEAFSEALKLDPDNVEIQKAHREALEAEFNIPVSENKRIIRI